MLISKAGSFFVSVCLAELIYRLDFCIGVTHMTIILNISDIWKRIQKISLVYNQLLVTANKTAAFRSLAYQRSSLFGRGDVIAHFHWTISFFSSSGQFWSYFGVLSHDNTLKRRLFVFIMTLVVFISRFDSLSTYRPGLIKKPQKQGAYFKATFDDNKYYFRSCKVTGSWSFPVM